MRMNRQFKNIFVSLDDEQVRKLTQESFQQHHRGLTSHINKLAENKCPFESIPKGIPHYSKKFRFFDLWTQFKRLLCLAFIADVRILIGVLANITINLILFALITNKDMLMPEGCLPFDIEHYNQTCQNKLENDRLNMTFFTFLTFTTLAFFTISIGMNSLVAVNFMKVLRHEYRNGKAMCHQTINEKKYSLISIIYF